MMQAIVKSIRNGIGNDHIAVNTVDELLSGVILEPLEGMPPEKAAKLVRRAKRVTQDALAILDGQVAGIQYLAIAYFISSLTERGVITIGAESSFAQAWDTMTPLLEHFSFNQGHILQRRSSSGSPFR